MNERRKQKRSLRQLERYRYFNSERCTKDIEPTRSQDGDPVSVTSECDPTNPSRDALFAGAVVKDVRAGLSLNLEHDRPSAVGVGPCEIQVRKQTRTLLVCEIHQLGARCAEAFEIADDPVRHDPR